MPEDFNTKPIGPSEKTGPDAPAESQEQTSSYGEQNNVTAASQPAHTSWQNASAQPMAPTETESSSGTATFAAAPAVQPQTVQPAQQNPQFQPAVAEAPVASGMPPQKKKNKKLLWGIISGVAAVLLIGGGAAAYAWYQNPDKVMFDAVVNSLSAKTSVADATMNITSDTADAKLVYSTKMNQERAGGNVKLTVTPKGEYEAIGDINLEADGVYEREGTIYFKVSKVKEAVEKTIDSYLETTAAQAGGVSAPEIAQAKQQIMDMVTPIVDEIDDQWIKVTPEDIKDTTSSDSYNCFRTAFEELEKDRSLAQGVYKAYQANKFIVIEKELGVKDGNVGYEIRSDKTKAEAFSKEFRNTEFGKKLAKCDESQTADDITNDVTADDAGDSNVQIWIGQWSHTLNRVVASGSDKDDNFKLDFEMNMKYNTPVTVDVPTNAKSIKEVTDKLESAMQNFYGTGSSTTMEPIDSGSLST